MDTACPKINADDDDDNDDDVDVIVYCRT